MTVTISLNANENRYGTSRFWEAVGTTVTSGTLQTARWSWWLYRAGTLVDQNHTGPCFQHTFDDADNGVSFDLYLHVLEEGAGSATEEHLTWTQTVDNWDRTYYVDSTGPLGDGLGLSAANAMGTVSAAFSAAKTWWSGSQSVRILLNGGQTHDCSARQHYSGDNSVEGRWGLGQYGTGTATLNMTADTDILTLGQGFNDRHSTLDIRDLTVTGNDGTADFIRFNVNSGATGVPPSFSFVAKNLNISTVGQVSGTARDNGDLTGSEPDDGRCNHIAWTDVTATTINSYGHYHGDTHAPRFVSFDGCTWSDIHTAPSATNTAIRSYAWRYVFFRGNLAYDHEDDCFRFLSGGSDTTLHSRYLNICDTGSYSGPYTFHNTSSDGGSPSDEENRFQDTWYHSIRCNSTGAGSAGIVLGGYRQRISVRACWFRGTTIDFNEHDTNNDTGQYLHVECNTWYVPTAGGGDGVGVRTTHNSTGTYDHWYVQNNFGVIAAETGTPEFWDTSGTGTVADSTLSASNYNIWIIPGGGALNWYGGMTSGGVSLSSWQGSTVYDDNSSAASGTHGLTATGTAGTADDYDFNISTSSAAYNTGVEVPGAQIEKRGYLRVATHDAGASDQAASAPPSEPGATASGQPTMARWHGVPFGPARNGRIF